ncbi:type VI secretion system membrane subunit TssM [Roseobacter sp. GAI101]|uniref:type VI secretion system membrane subunit TssM n=1 Tax=Roseobacter sp. (strain GAI101) TaxID=391589 RepID=UPI000300BDA1|nr:type VI secretion system membrane subunit TssM [Roseobacter sp. GAI101]
MRTLTKAVSTSVYLLGAAALCAAIWFGLPILGVDMLAMPELRAGLIGAVLLVLLVAMVLRRRKRKRAARSLEQSLVASQVGDGEVLAERMQDALAQLKKSGGATALYDLPWYVMIGPPGAGKTTALVHSGLDFPGTDPRSVAGFGGTRNCDFWFAKDAVLVDTAGRYTTQDSDAQADRASWGAFLGQLKAARSDQPINGIILAFSCTDLMTAEEAELNAHADTIRARLAEVHETLRTHVPVYVIFTKADIIAGFRQYFGGFEEARRRGVWGVTFQTRSRKEQTWQTVPDEYARLMTRLSDEVSDRMAEELDSATRIAIYGFPNQMEMLEPKITGFLRGVFEGASQTKAILRGFYFTSGTQEGTPIDQVLGSIAANGAGGMQPAFMSGRGRSFFLHDLLKKVIFAERDWVGYDRRRMVRRTIFRGLAKTAIATACIAAAGAFGYSFWNNASLVREANAQTQAYAQRADLLLNNRYIENAATRPLLPALAAVRAIPAGYADPRPQTALEQFGLSRRDVLRGAAVEAYSDSLERLLRPRMMLLAERRLADALIREDHAEAYRALKVYILLAKEQNGRDDDLAIQSYFAQAWTEEYQVSGSDKDYRAINAHLAAMLALDDRVSPPIKPNKALVDRAREELFDLPLAVQVLTVARSEAAVLPQWHLADVLAEADRLRLTDGRAAKTLVLPGLFTFDGYWDTFQKALSRAQETVDAEAWVLAKAITAASERARLTEDVHTLYAQQFAAEWNGMLGLVAGNSDVTMLAALADVIATQAQVARFLDPDPDTGQESDALRTVKGMWPQLSSIDLRRRAEEIAQGFKPWLGLVQGTMGARPVDTVIKDLTALSTDPERLQEVATRVAALPPLVGRMAGYAGLAGAETVLTRDVTDVCHEKIAPFYPFGGETAKPLPVADFGAFFGYGGQVDRFWQTYGGKGSVVLPVSESVQAEFGKLDALRAGLFEAGSSVPKMALNLRLGGVTKGVTSVDVDLGNGVQRLVSGGPGIVIDWPANINGMVWTVNGDLDDVGTLTLDAGPWSVIDLIRRGGDVQTEGANVDMTHRAGWHAFRISLGVEGGTKMPFLDPIWQDFTCPDRLE